MWPRIFLFFHSWRMANVSPKKHHLNRCTVLCVLDKYLLFLGGGFATGSCTPQASFFHIDKEEFFDSTEIKRFNVNLESMPLMFFNHQSPSALLVDGRVLVGRSAFEVFTPSCLSPWLPKEGQWNRVDFDLRPFRDSTALVNLSGTIYGLGEFLHICCPHYLSLHHRECGLPYR